MKDKWVSTKEFCKLTGTNKISLYSKICSTRRTDPYHHRKYKREGNRRLINYGYFKALEAKIARVQGRFEDAYYAGLERYGNEFAFSTAIARHIDTAPVCVNNYLIKCFLAKVTRVTERRLEYIEAMERVTA
jgi:hypothetical protein